MALKNQKLNFEFVNLSNGKLSTEKSSDAKIVIIETWASWCKPCLKSIPGFIELSKKYSNDTIDFYLVNVEPKDSQTKIDRVLSKFDGVDKVYKDQGSLINKYNINAIPVTLIFHRDSLKEVISGYHHTNVQVLSSKLDSLMEHERQSTVSRHTFKEVDDSEKK